MKTKFKNQMSKLSNEGQLRKRQQDFKYKKYLKNYQSKFHEATENVLSL